MTLVPAEDATYRKVTWRLLPFLVLCYVVAYLDRVNIGFARLQMLGDLRFSETVYGLGAGIFFIGYFLFEVPSNMILLRAGARLWIGRIMITWGLVSAAFAFVTTPGMFYFLRFLLGVAEAGFFPGIILYLTHWYPSERRAHMVALFMTATPLAGVLGGPLSGWVMESFAGLNGWAGWQWLFIVEAVPSIVMGIAVLIYLDNDIAHARWLDAGEKALLEGRLEADRAAAAHHRSLRAVFADGRVWLMCAIYFCYVMGHYGLTFWLPTLIQAAGVRSTLDIGLVTAIPYGGAVLFMIALARSADRRRERRWHTAGSLVLGAAGLVASVFAGTRTSTAVVSLTIAAAGVFGAGPVFWSLPTAFLGGAAAAAGIAAVNSVATWPVS
jgi:sugar phosphate permease